MLMIRQLNTFFGVGVAAFLLALSGCSNPDNLPNSVQTQPYFSLADYFGKEAVRLQQLNPEITKTVTKNGEEERKNIKVTDWEKEFALFIDADINKPAWRNSYRVDSAGSSMTYTSTDSALRTKEIYIEKSDLGAISYIRVTNRVSNALYQTDEQLAYYVDSLYRITKQQHVQIIGESHYTVTGEWP